MASIEEILANRRNAAPRTSKVTVLLDGDTSERISELEVQLEALADADDQRLGMDDGADTIRGQIQALRAASADALVTLEFERLPGDLWIDLCSRNPVRGDSIIDLNYGYNLDAAVRDAAKATRGGHAFAWRVTETTPEILTDTAWDELFPLLSGHDFSAIRDAVWALNEWEPAQRLAAAKKASAGTVTGSN